MTEASRVQKLLSDQNAEIDRFKARIKKLEAALHQWDNLIAQQFTGSRAAMSAMHDAAQITAALLHGDAPWPETRIEKLETALREIVGQLTTDPHEFCDKTWDIARNALEGKDD